MSAGHTKGKLSLFMLYGDHEIRDQGGRLIAVSTTPQYRNARRLVACWNACEGIETYALELMTDDLSIHHQITTTARRDSKPTSRKAVEYRRERDALLQVLEDLLQTWPHVDPAKTRAAIQAATGSTPT